MGLNKEYILETETLYYDNQSRQLGLTEKFIWGKFYIDLREIISWAEFIKDNTNHPFTEIGTRYGNGHVINMPLDEFNKIITKTIES